MKFLLFILFTINVYCLSITNDCDSSKQKIKQHDNLHENINRSFSNKNVNKNININSNKTQNESGQSSSLTKATFYFRVGGDVDGCPSVQTFNDGMSYGPCRGEDGSQGVKYTSNSKYWAAIANGGGRCGEMITVTYGSKSLQLKVMDECPACKEDNHVDMSLDALIELTGSKEIACAINRPMPMISWY